MKHDIITNDVLAASLALLFSELTDGPRLDGAYMLNGGDAGLLRSLDALSAVAASTRPASGGASIAAHVDHVLYGLSLMNRWSGGEADPWTGAEWAASWRRNTVTEPEWTALRARLRDETSRWRDALRHLPEVTPMELNGVMASIAHLAYHFGAIRQIDRSIRGPLAE